MRQRKSKYICNFPNFANQRKVSIAVINETDLKMYLWMLIVDNESATTVSGIHGKSNLLWMLVPTKLWHCMWASGCVALLSALYEHFRCTHVLTNALLGRCGGPPSPTDLWHSLYLLHSLPILCTDCHKILKQNYLWYKNKNHLEPTCLYGNCYMRRLDTIAQWQQKGLQASKAGSAAVQGERERDIETRKAKG